MAPIQIHFFRTTVKHIIASLHLPVDYPVDGVVVVLDTVRDVDAYIRDHQTSVAEQRMRQIAEAKSHDYPQIVAAMMMIPAMRKVVGADVKMPRANLRHTSPAASCEACQEAARCSMKSTRYVNLRARLEQIASRVTNPDAQKCLRLENLLNSEII